MADTTLTATRSLMPPAERQAWLLHHIGRVTFADILDDFLVERYVAVTGAAAVPQPYGAAKCPMLGRDLAEMYRQGLLIRYRQGLTARETGFPAWVYCYEAAPTPAS